MRCYLLGLGSNISPDINIPSACRALDMLGDVLQVSPAIATTTVGDTFTGPFMNQLVILQTELTEITLKENLLAIESRHGREAKTPARKIKDRTIDIDILMSAGNAADCLHARLDESYYREVQQHWLQEENV
ncbi:MAG: 2-amino-4-hydroxy-6-hydroxymethyldihydropteridine diphosphokinase [Oceanospirillaceae bacterium]|nr:2-amino-4-hydroxy-6-hydroxymethyldihydropteridine diphosphokinase [Oceanospirillaceae bacterium]MBT13643.1 2-amino-4-hydroxy-6-hydroxymethyldihydropteridine diphosphokinase [Oceanospirillaceae bacterium]|tara:strand:- start:1256 stop:1651 length:396 start_codon:yes stop_codon:yes gene_type:complete